MFSTVLRGLIPSPIHFRPCRLSAVVQHAYIERLLCLENNFCVTCSANAPFPRVECITCMLYYLQYTLVLCILYLPDMLHMWTCMICDTPLHEKYEFDKQILVSSRSEDSSLLATVAASRTAHYFCTCCTAS